MLKSELQQWYLEDLDEIISLESRVRVGYNVIKDVAKISKLCQINRELDRRINPPRLSGRVEIWTELEEVN